MLAKLQAFPERAPLQSPIPATGGMVIDLRIPETNSNRDICVKQLYY
jgi:hypothetical protein